MSDTPTSLPALESVLCTEALNRRPTRPPDYERESRALVSLAQALADSPRNILQTLADTILEVFQVGSTGISLLTEDGTRFHWPAIAGVWKPHIGGGTPRDFGPCGEVLDRNCPLLFSHPGRRYTSLQPVTPPVEECLLVPFYVEGQAVGTIWAITHDDRRKFDNEDLRMLVSLGAFASAAYLALKQSHAITEQAQKRQDAAHCLREMNEALLVSSIRQHELAEQAQQAEHKLQNSEVRYRRLFEASKEGVLILDFTSGKIVDANPFMSDLLGYSRDDFLGRELWEIGRFGDKSASETAVRELQEKSYVRYEHLPLETDHGRRIDVEVVANIHREDEHSVIQCNIRDISERSQLESRLRGQSVELADLHRRKDEFLAMLSHELRSPLAPIANAVELLGLQQGSETPIQLQARSIIQRQTRQLQRLVDDLLEVSRITTGRVQLRRKRVAVSRIVEGAVETVRPLIEQLHHELTVSLPPEPIWLNADVARLEQVLANLLSNAAKYTEEGGQIWLTVELASGGCQPPETIAKQPQAGNLGGLTPTARLGECIIRVRDTGVGISAELLPHIFDLFTQAERSLDRSQGGLGIGLALVQRLTELHGGTVEVVSEPGQGSEFIVRLPVAASEEPESHSPVSGTKGSTTRPLRVLMVDDNVDTVLSFSMLLRALGHEVRTAHDGRAALQAAVDYEPDVVLLDIGLPGLNGHEVAQRIRQESALRDVMLIALTGYGQESDRRAALQAGFNHHLVKPARLEDLQKILATVSHQSGTTA